MPSLTCPLCRSNNTNFYHQDKKRHYHQCQHCSLVFVPPSFHLSHQEEKSEYDKHENAFDDQGYLTFLQRAADPLLEKLSSKPDPLRGLDFGCGPSPVLARYLSKQGLNMSVYDPYYYPDTKTLSHQYDVVTCTEVVEHFNQPKQSLETLFNLVKPGGILAIMTKLVISPQKFAHWHYKNDPTHISFFSESTFRFVAYEYGVQYEKVANDVILLTF